MVAKTRVKKLPRKRMTRKQQGGDPMIEVIIGDINTLNKRITKKYTDGSSFKTQMIDPFHKIALDIHQKLKDDVSTKYLDKLSNTLSTFLSSIRSNQASLTQFYPNSYLVLIPQEIQGLLEAIRDKKESMSKIEAIAIQRKAEQDAAARLKKEKQETETRLKKEKQTEKTIIEQKEREQKEREQKEAKARQEEEKTRQKEERTRQKEEQARQEEERKTAKLETKKKNIAELEEKIRLKNERIEKERIEKERLEKERLEKERLEKERLEKEQLEKEQLEKEQLEKEQLENKRMSTEENDRRTYLFKFARNEERKKKIIEGSKKNFEKRDLQAKQAIIIEQFNVEFTSLFDNFSRIFEKHFEVLQDSHKLVSIVKEIYPNVLNYTDKINTLNKDDMFLYKYFSFYLFILIGMLNHYLKSTVPDLKLVIKGGKAAQMILSPNPTLGLKSDDIDILVQHPDPLYAKIFSQHFASFFKQQTRDNEHISILLENPINPNVVKVSYKTKDDEFVVISDIDSKPVLHLCSFKKPPSGAVMSGEDYTDCALSMRNGENPELFEIIDTKKSKDIKLVDRNGLETEYPFRLIYYHQTYESFIKEKEYYRDLYSHLPPSYVNTMFISKANNYLTMMAPSASSPKNMMPPVPPPK